MILTLNLEEIHYSSEFEMYCQMFTTINEAAYDALDKDNKPR